MKRIFIIAEAGVNHNGDIEIAKKLIDAAADAGADAVKFQTFKAEKIVRKDAEKAEYQRRVTADHQESQYEMLKKLELTQAMHEELMTYCSRRRIMFLSTPFDIESVRMLDHYGIEIMKVPSGEITNYPYLREIGRTGRPVIMSTGMSNIDEVKAAVEILRKNGSGEITLLHCNTEYPTPMEDVNLRAMCAMGEALQLPVGYSDHTLGIEIPIAAAALGAVVIEKHFTLDKNMDGPDHKASLEPWELQAMIRAVRNIELAMGDGIKTPSDSELKNRNVVRKSIVAKKNICKDELFTEENLTTKRPGDGISPMRWDELIGTKAGRDYKEDDMIDSK